MKKVIVAILALSMAAGVFCGFSCGVNDGTDGGEVITTPDPQPEDSLSAHLKTNLSADGYVRDNIGDFSVYENTSAYRVVTTAEELTQAIVDAKYHYTNVWNDESGTYAQVPADGYTEENFEGTVHVIEIANDLNLGYNVLSDEAKASGVVEDFSRKTMSIHVNDFNSEMVKENGISQIKVENTSNLLIYSKNGAKLTHCGFKLTSDDNVVFRNLEMDEIWQWEDSPSKTTSAIGDYDFHGWAYFKIAFCGYIWIDHCTFGKSYDGQIDVSNPEYTVNAGVAFRAPYGANGTSAVHISWCNFNAGSDDEDGYLYKMMQDIEEDYQNGGAQCLYYKTLRDAGATFEEILYGIAIPQKKGFLCGDSGDEYAFNLKLQISFANCTFKNLEDRLPKVRGGNACMYNCVVDSSEYYVYRTKLRSRNAAGLVSAVNSSWKCGLVSQGIVCGNGGSVKAENCIYRGIENLLKNNDSNSAELVKGGYKLVNCSYQLSATSQIIVGSSSDENAANKFPNSSPSILSPEYFVWRTEDGEQPFTPSVTALEELEEYLADADYGAGAHSSFKLSLLKSKY
ncbi:MAG: hypothetical protein K2O89_05500 [Clostridia bacterium]|nr:hypothetical protein [Clostridia bacterium]